MRHHLSWISWAAILAAILLLLAPRSAHGQPVIFSVETHRGNDTLYVGERAFISFDVDGQGAEIQRLVFPLEFSFGAGSLMGNVPDEVRLDFDFILFARCIFMCSPGTWPILDLGDVNCNGAATVSDAIHIVNYVFKGVPLPFCCNVLD